MENQDQRIARFMGGLKTYIQEKLIINPTPSLEELINRAEQIEKHFASINRYSSYSRGHKEQQMGEKLTQSSVNNTTRILDMPKEGRTTSDNPYKQVIKCCQCQEIWHKSNVYPKKRGVHFYDVEDSDEVRIEEVDDEANQVFPNEAKHLSCIIHQSFLAPRWRHTEQRRNLFKTRGTIKAKTVDIIINNRSLDNLISKQAVVVLKLKRQPHKKPYQISWIRHGEWVKSLNNAQLNSQLKRNIQMR